MVVLLHFNNDTMGGAFVIVRDIPTDNFILHFLESLCICAVNCFMIVSGYFLYTNKTIKFGKVCDILLIVVFYRYLNYIMNVVVAGDTFSWKSLAMCIFPDNYFAILYVVSYILSPYFSKVYRELSDKKADFLTAVLFLLFIIAPTFIDIANDLHIFKNPGFLSPISTAGNGEGFTIVQFLVCLSLGMWIRKRNIQVKTYYLLSTYFLSSLFLTMGIKNLPSLYNYCSVLTVVNAICLFLLFQKFHFQNAFVNYASKSCFAIFCIHTSGFFNGLWRQYFITEEHFSSGLSSTMFWTLVSVVGMFFFCLLLSIVMRLVFGKPKDYVCGKFPVINCD